MYVITATFACLSALSLLIWVYLVFFRGMFWKTEPWLDASGDVELESDADWPSIAAVVPARNESHLLPDSLSALLAQEYPGVFHVYLVDDKSEDGTAEVAQRLARDLGAESRLTVVMGVERRAGWKGKVWAMSQGIEASKAGGSAYVLLVDADVALQPGLLKALVAHAERERLDLASLMTLLRVESAWDRLLIPAFVYFFAKLYPFRWICSPHNRTAGANGGCILVRRQALEKAGGLDAMRDAMIDDCALGRLIKSSGGRLWLGYTRDVRGRRAHGDLSATWNMVARYAFAQLGYSYLLLLGTVLGMLLTYLVPPLGIALGAGSLATLGNVWAYTLLATGAVSWLLMAASYLPMLRLYGVSCLCAPFLPLSALMYTLMTVASGIRHWQGRGGDWKGRTYGYRKACE